MSASPRAVLTAAAAAQATVSIVAFRLPAIGPDLRTAYGRSLPMLGASGAGSAVVPIAGARALFRVYEADRRGLALGVRQMALPLGGTVAGAALLLVNVAAGVARIVWGRPADRGRGERRVRTLVEAGALAAVGALTFVFAFDAGSVALLVAATVFAFGALGWNALVYVTTGEKAPRELAGQAAAFAAAVVFVVSALSATPLGALAEHAGWDVFWLTTALLAAAGAAVAATLSPGTTRSAPLIPSLP